MVAIVAALGRIVGAGAVALCTVGVAGAQATCAGISDPAPLSVLENAKEILSQGQVAEGFGSLGIPAEPLAGLTAAVSEIVKAPATSCVTIKRVRPGPNFLSEIFALEIGDQFLFFTVSGVVMGDDFRVVNVSYTGDFDQVREYLY